MKRIALVLLIIVSISASAYANDKLNPDSNPETPVKKLWIGLGMGFAFGFGSGQAVQDRWRESGWQFAAADSLGLLLLLATFGDGPSGSSSSQNRFRTIGVILIMSSRVVQVAELGIYGVKQGMLTGGKKETPKHEVTFGVSPTLDSQGLIAAGTLTF